MKADYSEWLDIPHLMAEEEVWAKHPRPMVDIVKRMSDESPPIILRVLEVGCGTGWNALHLGYGVNYIGVDANPHCIARAKMRAPWQTFVQADVRAVLGVNHYNLIMAESFLKHFAYEEWLVILPGLLGMCDKMLFTMPVPKAGEVSVAVEDDGPVNWPHLRVSREVVSSVVQEGAGHEIIETWHTDTEEPMYLTRRLP